MSAIKPTSIVSSGLHVEQTRSRTARKKPEGVTFGSVLRAGAGAILQGVELGAGVLGGTALSAPIRAARRGIEGMRGEGPLTAGRGTGGGGSVGEGGDRSTMDEVRSLQEEAQNFNMEYLALQEETQQENRRFSTVSNVLKAKHDTSKAAINNIRS
mgnify:CR=1 FL=1